MPTDHGSRSVLTDHPPPAAADRLLATLLPAVVLVPAASTVVAVALPAIMADLELGSRSIWWLVTGYLLLVALLNAPAGRLGDRVGHDRLLLGGTGLLTAAAVAAAAAPDAPALVTARLLQGVAGAAIVPAGLALVRRCTGDAGRDRAVGIVMAGLAGGALLGVAGGGVLVVGGWRSAFVGLAVLGSLGTATAAVGRARIGGASQATTGDVREEGTYGGSLIEPAGAIALTSLSLYVVLLVVPLRAEAAGWESGATGLVLAGFVAATAAGSLVSARWSAVVGPRPATGAAAAVASAALAIVAGSPASVAWTAVGLVVAGVGLGSVMAVGFAVGLRGARRDRAGASSGFLSTARYVGSITGTALLPWLLDSAGNSAGLALAAFAALLVVPLLVVASMRSDADSGEVPEAGV